jgi:hypothetical protein
MNTEKLPILSINDFQTSFAQLRTVIEHVEAGLGIHPSAAENAAQDFVAFLEKNNAHHFIQNSRSSLRSTLEKMLKKLPVSQNIKSRTDALMTGWKNGKEIAGAKPSEVFLKLKNQLDHVYSVIIDLDRAHIGGANPQVSSAVSGLKALVKSEDVRQISPSESEQIFLMIHLIETSGAEKFKDLVEACRELEGKLPPKSPA